MADITGFTQLTETLGSRGTAGVEVLTKCINSFFRQVIKVVLLHGGDVMRFAGDSIICLFAPTETERAKVDRGLASATLRSVQCAAVLQRQLGQADVIRLLNPTKGLSFPYQRLDDPQFFAADISTQ